MTYVVLLGPDGGGIPVIQAITARLARRFLLFLIATPIARKRFFVFILLFNDLLRRLAARSVSLGVSLLVSLVISHLRFPSLLRSGKNNTWSSNSSCKTQSEIVNDRTFLLLLRSFEPPSPASQQQSHSQRAKPKMSISRDSRADYSLSTSPRRRFSFVGGGLFPFYRVLRDMNEWCKARCTGDTWTWLN